MVGRHEYILFSGSRPTYDKALTSKFTAYITEEEGYTKPFPHLFFYYFKYMKQVPVGLRMIIQRPKDSL